MELIRAKFDAMASTNDIQVYASTRADADRYCRAAIQEVQRIEAKYSRYQPHSVITEINAASGQGGVTVDAETAYLLTYADRCFHASNGLFDITSGALRRVWDFRGTLPPPPEAIAAMLPCIGWQHVDWNGARIRIGPGMEIDFGGLGKEYAADRAATACIEAGARHGFINLAGDIRVFGPHPDGRPWRIGIRHPRIESQTIATLEIAKGALATSGDYERFFEHAGVRYCHILNPKTGWPVRFAQSVSVVAPVCLAAGSFSTIAMLLADQGAAFLEREGVDFLLVDAAGSGHGPLSRPNSQRR